MRTLEDRAACVLRRNPAAATTASELRDAIAADGGGPGVDTGVLVDTLRRVPRRFRVLAAARGPWMASDLLGRAESYSRPLLDQGVSFDPWIVFVEPPGEEPDDRGSRNPLAEGTKESLVCLARTLDEDSPDAVNRWCRLLREDRRRNATALERGG